MWSGGTDNKAVPFAAFNIICACLGIRRCWGLMTYWCEYQYRLLFRPVFRPAAVDIHDIPYGTVQYEYTVWVP